MTSEQDTPPAKRRGRPPKAQKTPPSDKSQRLSLAMLERVSRYRQRQMETTGKRQSVKNLIAEAWSVYEGNPEYECISLLTQEQREIVRRIVCFMVSEKSEERDLTLETLKAVDRWIGLIRQFKAVGEKLRKKWEDSTRHSPEP